MVTFRDGPAKGETLILARIPKLLRVTRSRGGEFDALDQLDDEPRRDEEIFVYVRQDDPPPWRYHLLCGRGRGKKSATGWWWNASYTLFRGSEPADSELRDTAAWRAWAERQNPGRIDAIQRGETGC